MPSYFTDKKMKSTIRLIIVFSLSSCFASTAIASNSSTDNLSFCSGYYHGVSESQPYSGIGKEALSNAKYFDEKNSSPDQIYFEKGHKIGISYYDKKRNRIYDIENGIKPCQSIIMKYISRMTEEELNKSVKETYK